MGGNTIVLLHGSQIEKGRELETTISVLLYFFTQSCKNY